MEAAPYLFLEGRTAEAIAFYEKTLGAKTNMLMRWKDAPPSDANFCPGGPENVMHAELQIGPTRLLVSDGRCSGTPSFAGFSISLTVKDAAEAERVFHALAEGGTVTMPLGKTFFSPMFGMVADKFGVGWMVYAVPAG